jgi:hypothetical protein
VLYQDYVNRKELLRQVNFTPRPFTKFLIANAENDPLTGVEIGFGLGDNAQSLLNELNIKRLYCVDPYINQAYPEGDSINYGNLDHKKNSLFEKIRLDPRVRFLYVKSVKAFTLLPKVDFCYIDGAHNYDSVKADLEGAHRIVKIGGYIAGHDIHQKQVKEAVDDFAWSIKQRPIISIPDFWFLRKKTKG